MGGRNGESGCAAFSLVCRSVKRGGATEVRILAQRSKKECKLSFFFLIFFLLVLCCLHVNRLKGLSFSFPIFLFCF